jgi:hypothetical protein
LLKARASPVSPGGDRVGTPFDAELCCPEAKTIETLSVINTPTVIKKRFMTSSMRKKYIYTGIQPVIVMLGK